MFNEDQPIPESCGLRSNVYKAWWFQNAVRDFMWQWYLDHMPERDRQEACDEPIIVKEVTSES